MIKIIAGFETEVIHNVCPYTAKFVRPLVKLPMITIMMSAGSGLALNLTCFTFIGQLLKSGTFDDAPWLILFLIVWGVGGAVVLLFVTNFANSIYDQVDVIPVY